MVRALAIAAGGGGDAITAAVLGRKLEAADLVAIMSYSWDRLMLDPEPGPRTCADFIGLLEPVPNVYEVTGASALRGGGHPTLPALAACLPFRFLLLDPIAGAVGLSSQIAAAAQEYGADEILIVDVGGDILAAGHEPGLRTPLADSLVVAACAQTGLAVRVLVAGLGLDGELTEAELDRRAVELGAAPLTRVESEDFEFVRALFEWHPSEANGLLEAAADGVRGIVETRQGSTTVEVTDASTVVYEVDYQRVLDNSIAAQLVSTGSLDEAEHVVRKYLGGTEIDFERRRWVEFATRRPIPPTDAALEVIDEYARRAHASGIDYLTVRRVAELVQAIDLATGTQLRQLLTRNRPDYYLPPVYRTAH